MARRLEPGSNKGQEARKRAKREKRMRDVLEGDLEGGETSVVKEQSAQSAGEKKAEDLESELEDLVWQKSDLMRLSRQENENQDKPHSHVCRGKWEEIEKADKELSRRMKEVEDQLKILKILGFCGDFTGKLEAGQNPSPRLPWKMGMLGADKNKSKAYDRLYVEEPVEIKPDVIKELMLTWHNLAWQKSDPLRRTNTISLLHATHPRAKRGGWALPRCNKVLPTSDVESGLPKPEESREELSRQMKEVEDELQRWGRLYVLSYHFAT